MASPVVSNQAESLTPDDMQRVTALSGGDAYRIGPNDVIAVSVYMHPELSVPAPGGSAGTNGVLVTADGSISLPLINTINVSGLTPAEAGNAIAAAYGAYLKNPSVSVQIVTAQSMRYYLLGAFTEPGVKYPGHALDLLDALALGGSVDLSNADLYQAYVAQGDTKLPVDLHALLVAGDMSQNITLGSGDAIVIPSSANENAYVFGSVGKPGSVPFQEGSLSLLQALSEAQLDLTSLSSAEMSQIHLIRAHGSSAEFMVIDAKRIMNGTAMPFALEPGDIVFVPPTQVASWNEVLNMLLPTLSTISGILNPFVSIKYLSQPTH
jgi:polysaccharide biosynthesis/export protein